MSDSVPEPTIGPGPVETATLPRVRYQVVCNGVTVLDVELAGPVEFRVVPQAVEG